MSHVLSQIPLLVIFDNFEAQLSHHNGVHEITDENLRVFLRTLMQTTAQGSRFVFTSRYLFEVDERRVGTIRHIPLEDLSRPEALGLMQNLPHLASAPFEDKLRAYATFGGHPYALVTLDRHCSRKTLAEALEDAKTVHMESDEFEKAAEIIIAVTELLNRWGLGRFLESLYGRIIPKVKRERQSRLIHNLGILLQARGDYESALKQYDKSLKIAEEFGDRAGVARSRGQIGELFSETNRFPEAFDNLFTALRIFSEIGSPDARIVTNYLRTLRAKWGVESFDSAWREKTGEDVPDWLKE
jgi:tetratricopeptide (TPR) repeat protein